MEYCGGTIFPSEMEKSVNIKKDKLEKTKQNKQMTDFILHNITESVSAVMLYCVCPVCLIMFPEHFINPL